MSIQDLNFQISGTSPIFAAGAGVIGSSFSGLQEFSRCAIVGTLLGATGGTLNLIVQTSFDGKHVSDSTKTWWDAAAFAQVGAGALLGNFFVELVRGNSGVTPVALTQGTLAAGTVLPNMLGDGIRLWGVPGSGTTVGAVQQLAVAMFQVP